LPNPFKENGFYYVSKRHTAMLTLIRPEKDSYADWIERRLKKMTAAYKVIYKEISTITYLIESGEVFKGDTIKTFLDQYQDVLSGKQRNATDGREIG
jgi:DNA-binding ferritin-like protein (Dps family)